MIVLCRAHAFKIVNSRLPFPRRYSQCYELECAAVSDASGTIDLSVSVIVYHTATCKSVYIQYLII